MQGYANDLVQWASFQVRTSEVNVFLVLKEDLYALKIFKCCRSCRVDSNSPSGVAVTDLSSSRLLHLLGLYATVGRTVLL